MDVEVGFVFVDVDAGDGSAGVVGASDEGRVPRERALRGAGDGFALFEGLGGGEGGGVGVEE